MTHMRQDVREALRRAVREPGFTALAILTLALGIGVNTSMFSVIRTVLLEPLPYGDPDGLIMAWNIADRREMTWLSIQEVVGYRDGTPALESFGAYTDGDANLTGGGEPERVGAAQVTPEPFSVLRVEPLPGRTFTAADGVRGNDDAVVLGHGLWQRRFGGDAAVVGRRIEVRRPHANGPRCHAADLQVAARLRPRAPDGTLDAVRDRSDESG